MKYNRRRDIVQGDSSTDDVLQIDSLPWRSLCVKLRYLCRGHNLLAAGEDFVQNYFGLFLSEDIFYEETNKEDNLLMW